MDTEQATEASTTTAAEMVARLMDEADMSATDISDAMGRRVSRRTIYRWRKDESDPQQKSDLEELKKLYDAKFGTGASQ